MNNIDKNNLITTYEVMDLLRDNNIIVESVDTIRHWVEEGIFPKTIKIDGYCRNRCNIFYDKIKVLTWIDCYKKIMKKPKTRTRNRNQMKKVYEIYELILAKMNEVEHINQVGDDDSKTNNHQNVNNDNTGKEAKKKCHSANQIPVNEMRVIHTQFTNGEVKYLSKLHEEVDNILDYVQNFIFIDVPDINTELTNGDDVLKFYKDVFVMANTTQFILKSLKKATDEINELNSNIHIIIDNFLKRIAEK